MVTGGTAVRNRYTSPYSLVGKKSQTIVCCLLIIGFCLTQQVITAHAESAELPHELKQEEPEKKVDTKPRGRWLPIPIFLTEPAFGYGLGLVLSYFHPQKDGAERQAEPSLHTPQSVASGRKGQKAPPAITGVAGGYTENDTWAAAVGHSNSWRKDTMRYAGGLAYADVNSTYYILDKPFDFNLKGGILYQDLKFRLGNSGFFLGGKLLCLQTDSKFLFTIDEDTEIEVGNVDSRNIGVAADIMYDSRDNVFTPNRGQLLQMNVWRYDEGLGGDYNYWNGTLKLLSFFQLHPAFVLGLRLEGSAVDGRAPFYAYPYVSLRGIPALRYQGKRAGVIEAEARWNIFSRWAILGFAGTGAVGADDPSFETDDDIYAGGAGVRYFLMQDLGLWLGVDVARGPEDSYAYITVGQAW
jgi:hypothetical protein